MIFIFFDKVHFYVIFPGFSTQMTSYLETVRDFFKFQLIGVHKIQPKIIAKMIKVSYFSVQNLKFYNYKSIYIYQQLNENKKVKK